MQIVCEAVVRDREQVYRERPFPLRDGTVLWSGTTCTPVTNDDGDIVQIFVSTIDVTEFVARRRARVRELLALASGFVRICAWCGSVHDDERWISVEAYVGDQDTGGALPVVSCPTCSTKSAGRA